MSKLQSELDMEKSLNKCMTSNQEVYLSRLTVLEKSLEKIKTSKDAEIHELQLHLRDVMFYLDAQHKIAGAKHLISREEIESSKLFVTTTEIESLHGADKEDMTTVKSNKRANNDRRRRKNH